MYKETPDDLSLKYEGCFSLHKRYRIIKLNDFFYDAENNRKIIFCGKKYNFPSSRGTFVSDIFTSEDFKFQYPALGWVNTNRNTCHFIYKPNNIGNALKFKAALHPQVIKIIDSRELLNIPYINKDYLCNQAIISLFSKKVYPNIAKSYENIIHGKKHSIAISRKFIVQANFELDEVVLRYYLDEIGYFVNRNTVRLFPENSFLFETISQELGLNVCF